MGISRWWRRWDMGRWRGVLIFMVCIEFVLVTCRFSLNSVFWVLGGAAYRDDRGVAWETGEKKSTMWNQRCCQQTSSKALLYHCKKAYYHTSWVQFFDRWESMRGTFFWECPPLRRGWTLSKHCTPPRKEKLYIPPPPTKNIGQQIYWYNDCKKVL